MNTLSSLLDFIGNWGVVKTFTPHLYDYNTYKRALGNGKYFKIGKLVVGTICAYNADLSGINTMVQFRNLPVEEVWGGNSYIAQLSRNISVVQGDSYYIYLRPNVTSSDFSTPSNVGILSVLFVGVGGVIRSIFNVFRPHTLGKGVA